MQVTKAQAAKLAQLQAGADLPRSALPQALLQKLQGAGIVHAFRAGGGHRLKADAGPLADYARMHWHIDDLAAFAAEDAASRDRRTLIELAGDSKALPTRPLRGLFIRPWGASVRVGGAVLEQQPEGACHFVHESLLPSLVVEPRCVYGIENAEVLLHFERLRDAPTGPACLVLRQHWGEAWREWLTAGSVEFLHFADFDFSGALIFETEVLRFAPHAHLHVPSDIDDLLSQVVSPDLFDGQAAQRLHYLNRTPQHADVARLVAALLRHRRALEQEALLTNRMT